MKKQNEKKGNSSRQLNNRGSLPIILKPGEKGEEGEEGKGSLLWLWIVIGVVVVAAIVVVVVIISKKKKTTT